MRRGRSTRLRAGYGLRCCWLGLSFLLVFAPPSGFADIEIRAKNGLLTLHARTAPLVDVLERLSDQTGLKVVYDGRRPTQLVTADIEQLSEAEALSQLFEGLGLNYVFQTDASGRRVALLIISHGSSSGPSAAASRPASRPSAFPEDDREPPVLEPFEADGPDETPEPDPWSTAEAESPESGFAAAMSRVAPLSFPSAASHPVPLQPFPTQASYPSLYRSPFE